MYTCRGLHAAGRAVTSFWLQVVLLEDVEREGNNLSVIDGSLTRLVSVSFWVDSYPRHFHLQESMAGEPRSSAAARFAARLADFAAMRSNEVTGLALRRLATGPTFESFLWHFTGSCRQMRQYCRQLVLQTSRRDASTLGRFAEVQPDFLCYSSLFFRSMQCGSYLKALLRRL